MRLARPDTNSGAHVVDSATKPVSWQDLILFLLRGIWGFLLAILLTLLAILITLLHAWPLVISAIPVLFVIGSALWVLSWLFQTWAHIAEFRAKPLAEREAFRARERAEFLKGIKVMAWVLGGLVVLFVGSIVVNWGVPVDAVIDIIVSCAGLRLVWKAVAC